MTGHGAIDARLLARPGAPGSLRRRLLASATALLMAAVGLLAVAPLPARAAVAAGSPAEQQFPLRKAAKPSRVAPLPKRPDDAAKPWKASNVTWPSAASAVVDVQASTGKGARAGLMPVYVKLHDSRSETSKLLVTVADRTNTAAANVDGTLVSLRSARTDNRTSTVQVSLDYSGFADAFAADWASRARLAVMPACALTTPTLPSCQVQTPLPTTRDSTSKTLTATVTVPGQPQPSTPQRPLSEQNDLSETAAPALVLATQAAPAGPNGDYGATPLQPSGSWSAGGNSGDFGYSYPIVIPPVVGSNTPEIALSYSSQSIDGKMVSTNSQSSWVGDGWDYQPGYVEQSYVTCSENPAGTAKNTADQCWAGQIVHVSFGAYSGDLVYDPDLPTDWKFSADNGAKVEQVRTAGTNGTDDGLHWKITAQDGTQYFFGRNKLPGWASGNTTTNSSWTVPVYSPYSGDPCYAKANHLCTMAWRWNLDYVVDAHHNALAYYYNTETNYYGRDGGTTAVPYTRGGVLDHIDYGLVDPTIYSVDAPARIKFNSKQRCVVSDTACAEGNITTTPSNWPDVPYTDANCASGATCNVHAPTFWSRLRLSDITTQIWNGTDYTPVDVYTLTQLFPNPGDGTSPSLWLSSIQRTGKSNGGSLSLPPVTFGATNKPNRVDSDDFAKAMNHNRISTITTETGEVIQVTYTSQQCTAPVSIVPESNTSLCYPVYWTPDGLTTPKKDWFNKYVVTQVDVQDQATHAPTVTTAYSYLGDPAWHYDDNELTKAKYRTWGQWRGYPRVQTRMGSGSDQKTLTEAIFYQGMDGDSLPSGATRTASVTLSTNITWPSGGPAATVPDINELAGSLREQITYDGDGGQPLSATATDYWVGPSTASRSRTNLPSVESRYLRPVASYRTDAVTSHTPVTWRTTKVETTYDTITGLPTVEFDHGDLGDPSQAICTVTTYAPANTTLNLVNLPAEVEVDAKACGGSGNNQLTAPASLNRPTDVISDTRFYYNKPTFDMTWPQAAPSNPDLSVKQQATGYTAGAFTYQTIAKSTYDAFGRPKVITDANGDNAATLTYYSVNGHPSQVDVLNAKGHKTQTFVEPSRGLATRTLDANNLETDQAYDDLGRVTGVWLPGNNNTSNPANRTIGYNVSNVDLVPTSVIVRDMNNDGSYRTDVTLYDSHLRTRQVQTQSPKGGRLIDDLFYDSRGWIAKNNSHYYDAAAPSTNLLNLTGQDNLVPAQGIYTYDGAGRLTVVMPQSLGAARSNERELTVYGGDRTTTIPAVGGTPTTTIYDARGRVMRRDYYTQAPTITGNVVSGGAYQSLTYGYDTRGNQNSVTDQDGNIWTSTFNLLGQVTDKTDPDTGSSHLSYDKDGNVATSTDSRQKTLSFKYDALNRPIEEHDGPNTSDPLLAEWTYDSTTIANGYGQLASATSYDNTSGTTYAYTTSFGGYTNRYKPTSTTVAIPADPRNGTLAGNYTFSNTYSVTNGLLTKITYPVLSGVLPSETVNLTYNGLDMPSGVGDLLGDYIDNTSYNQYGGISRIQTGAGTNAAYVTNVYDEATLRLQDSHVDRTTAPTRLDQVTYGYDYAGNIKKITDTRNDTTSETQCFDYDLLGRLTEAWTATDNCAADVAQTQANTTVSNASSSYWTSWTYNTRGDREQETQHLLPGQTGSNTVSTHAYGAANSQPHTLQSVTATGNNARNSTYTYDSAGNTLTRSTNANGNQTFTWNTEGRLTKVDKNNGAAVSTYTYGPDGGLLVQRGPGTVTIYLPGQELTLTTATGTKTGKRYYPSIGNVSAVRTGSTSTAYSFLIANSNGTSTLSLDRTGQTATWKSYTPFGETRGTQPGGWPDTHGFLAAPTDATTGLDLVGARNYDPTIGRFISADPILAGQDLTQLGGYAYAGNNPVSRSDPSGLYAKPGVGGFARAFGRMTATAAADAAVKTGMTSPGRIASRQAIPVVDIIFDVAFVAIFAYDVATNGGRHGFIRRLAPAAAPTSSVTQQQLRMPPDDSGVTETHKTVHWNVGQVAVWLANAILAKTPADVTPTADRNVIVREISDGSTSPDGSGGGSGGDGPPPPPAPPGNCGCAGDDFDPKNPIKVDSARLQGLLQAFFHGVGSAGQRGDGSAMAAANHQALTGELVEDVDHIASTSQLRSGLTNFLKQDVYKLKSGKRVPNVRTPRDEQVARSMIRAVDDGIAGRYNGLDNYPGLGPC
ncbi:RHS repeat-associated core domain-containing protein [Hamadaea sp. NPDC051192]|uniref:RHS repeat domain-containing protein n=1 Tax=Hamadaea sp. NPDC051192 TaxID=3154940 RepID=UPI00343B862B